MMQPQALSENCGVAQETLEKLVVTFESSIQAALLAEARRHLATQATVAEAWSDFAAAVLLMGDLELAAWAGLQAVRLDWDAELVGNAATYLLHAGRVEARSWLLCARDMGPRSVFVLEALAVAHEKAGDIAGARAAIGQARRLDPEDPMIEIEHSFLTTGKPPPPVSPPREAAKRCYADLELHARSIHARVEAQHARLDRLAGIDARTQAFAGAWERIYEPALAAVRSLIEAPAQRGYEALWNNQSLVQCITIYFTFTDFLLASVVRDSATTITFWAAAMRLDPAVFVRETTNPDVPNPTLHSASRLPSTAADRALSGANDEATRQYWRDIEGCNATAPELAANNACRDRALRRECTTNIADFEEWEARQRRNYNTAAQSFDRVALDLLRWVEGEVVNARAFAARYAQELKAGQPNLSQINLVYRMVLLEPNLTSGASGVDDFNAKQARWFEREKQWFEGGAEQSRQSLSQRCGPVLLREALEALAQEQWDAYRQELWDRMTANVEASWDPRINCDGKVDGFTVSIDDRGFNSLSAKWKNVGASLNASGKLKLSGSWKYRNVSINTQTTVQNGQVVSTSVGAGGSYPVVPGVSAKGGISIVSDGGREPAIAFSGSLELGFERGSARVSCTPGSGSFKVYPRAFTQAAIAYALAGGPR